MSRARLLLMAIPMTTLMMTFPAPASGQSDVPHVVVVAEVSRDDPHALRFAVRSRSRDVIEVYTSDLPWGNISSVVLVGVTSSGRRLVRDPGPIDDPDIATTLVNPGETVNGAIDLATRFPDLAGASVDEELLIFWSYRLVTTSGERGERTGGGCSLLLDTWRCWNEEEPARTCAIVSSDRL